jgi:hypothetical protein
MSVQVIAIHNSHRGEYGNVVRQNATGSYTVALENGTFRTFRGYELKALGN